MAATERRRRWNYDFTLNEGEEDEDDESLNNSCADVLFQSVSAEPTMPVMNGYGNYDQNYVNQGSQPLQESEQRRNMYTNSLPPEHEFYNNENQENNMYDDSQLANQQRLWRRHSTKIRKRLSIESINSAISNELSKYSHAGESSNRNTSSSGYSEEPSTLSWLPKNSFIQTENPHNVEQRRDSLASKSIMSGISNDNEGIDGSAKSALKRPSSQDSLLNYANNDDNRRSLYISRQSKLMSKRQMMLDKDANRAAAGNMMMGWGHDNDSIAFTTLDDNTITTNATPTTQNTSENDKAHKSSRRNTLTRIDSLKLDQDDDIYEDFGVRRGESSRTLEAAFKKKRQVTVLNVEEEYDSKRPWRKAPVNESNDNDNASQSTDNLSRDEFGIIDSENVSLATTSDKSVDDILLAQNCLMLYEDMNRVPQYFKEPHYEDIVTRDSASTTQQQLTPIIGNSSIQKENILNKDSFFDYDLFWLQQVQPKFASFISWAHSSNISKAGGNDESLHFSMYFGPGEAEASQHFAKDDISTSGLSTNSQRSELNLQSVIDGATKSWGQVKGMISSTKHGKNSLSNSYDPNQSLNLESFLATGVGNCTNLMSNPSLHFSSVLPNDTLAHPAADDSKKSSGTTETASQSDEDDNPSLHDSKTDNDTDVYAASTASAQQRKDYGEPDNESISQKYDLEKIDLEVGQNKKKTCGDSFSYFFSNHRHALTGFITLILIGGVIGVVFVYTSSELSEEETVDQPPGHSPEKMGWRNVFNSTGEGTGSISLASNGTVVVQKIDQEVSFFRFDSNLEVSYCKECEEDALSTSSTVYLSPDANHIIEVSVGTESSQVKITNTLSETKQVFEENIELAVSSVSVSNCRLALGDPSSTLNGIDSGLVRVYDFCVNEGNLTQIGGDITGNPETTAGNSISLSKNGKVLAIGAEKASDNGHFSGDVHVFQYDSRTKKWITLGNLLKGLQSDDNFGSSVALSNTGKRLAVGAKGHNLETDYTKTDAGFCQVYQLNKTRWDPLGSFLVGENYQSQFGKLVELSGNGGILFVSSNHRDLKAFAWDETDWMEIKPNIANVGTPKYLSASETGWRLGVGESNRTVIYQFEIMQEPKV